MSVADASFEEAWDIAKAHPLESRALRALKEGTSSPGYMSVMGNKGGPMHQAINRYLYGKSALRPGGTSVNRRLIEPFMGGLDVAFAIRPDEGLFGNDYDMMLPFIAEMVRDNPEKVAFDPRELLAYPGDEISLYPKPMQSFKTGDYDPAYTTEVRESDFAGLPSEYIQEGGGVYLPAMYDKLRNDINRKITLLRRGELGQRGKEELASQMTGMSRAMFNSILRYNSEGVINSAQGAKSLAQDPLSRIGQEFKDISGQERPLRFAVDSSAILRPQKMGQISTPDMQPYDLSPWSEMMQDFHFQAGDYRDFLDDLSLRPDTGFYGDYLVTDPPYGEQTGQHTGWRKQDTEDIYRRIREYGDQGVPVVGFNDASPTTVDAIRGQNLPMSLILARRDKGAKGKSTVTPETVVTQNIPGLTGVDFYDELIRDVTNPVGDLEVIPKWMFDEGRARRLEEKNLTTTIDDPATGRRSWMETDPARVARILSQPRYRRKVV
jgi:site-specific DNA-adenine methylase